ncbi:DMT family transporter [Lysinibacillus odysseyi]|uniref:Multidrug transporter n=1 Tax=Lysinibacillus odysseyi 34hs-1 = NBRC 100172 TaxID=1220589 RepID=A0A0A3IBW5_9BACI|nr:DMT family transporter [Lysinibacillus odysseyi]KGR82219.1 multidrug transporter [Lysinibacillus odysseyi 34hs-1 = NBRC 100172]
MDRLKGILMIVSGALCWGATGPMMEWLLHTTSITVSFMLAVRLIIAGTLLLLFLQLRGKKVMAIWKLSAWRNQLIIFSIVGMLGVQFTFVKSIEESNAIVATLLQFLAPIFIVVYISFIHKKWPPKAQIIGIAGTLFGLFLLLTNGSLQSLMVSRTALLWGVALGFTYAFYTLYPARLMKEWGVLVVVAWGLLLSGIELGVIGRIWSSDEWMLLTDSTVIWMMAALVILGSAAFVLFLSSLHYISAVETSVLSSVEPLAATIISVIWLDAAMYGWQYAGMLLMLIFVVYLSIAGKEKEVV